MIADVLRGSFTATTLLASFMSTSVATEQSSGSPSEAASQWPLAPPVIHALASRFESPRDFDQFISFADASPRLRSGLLSALAGADATYAASIAALAVTAYGYQLAKSGRYPEARVTWTYALVFRPAHQPAWAGLAVLSYNEQKCSEAVSWAEKVLTHQPSQDSEDLLEQVLASKGQSEADRDALEHAMLAALETTMSDSDHQLRSQMREIQDACHGRR